MVRHRLYLRGGAAYLQVLKRRNKSAVTQSASFLYAIIPIIAWVASGCLKFAINTVRYGRDARRHVGNGGFPSTHTSVVSSVAVLIGIENGWDSPLFGLGVALTWIVMIDAVGIRRAVGRNAERINRLFRELRADPPAELREKQGHTRFEVAGGLALGSAVAFAASLLV
jgi:acid phosphatase family membrane protein YuiD